MDIYESARSLFHHKNEELLKIYEREIKKGKKKQAYIVVARRLLYHIYSMMKNEKPYRIRFPNTKGGGGIRI